MPQERQWEVPCTRQHVWTSLSHCTQRVADLPLAPTWSGTKSWKREHTWHSYSPMVWRTGTLGWERLCGRLGRGLQHELCQEPMLTLWIHNRFASLLDRHDCKDQSQVHFKLLDCCAEDTYARSGNQPLLVRAGTGQMR